MDASAEGRELLAGAGRRVVLGALIKSGGAGSVYRVRADALVVAKLYHANLDLREYERKVEAMLALTPNLPDISEAGTRYVQIAWPSALLRDARGRFVGYLMPAVDVSATSELECVLQEKQARSLGLPTGLGAKITLAANLANVIAELHRQHHRVVDLKPVNLRFYPRSLYMAMLDCDGFSIQGQGERFEAPQFTVDYLAPEFQRGGLTAIGEEQQDRFALAVVIFQLLNFGIHPFTGRPTNERVPTDVPSRIAARLYAYGRTPNTQLTPSPVSGHEAMPADLRLLFDRAFDGPGAGRPSPLEWGAALRGYAQRATLRLTGCTQNKEHQHFAGLPCAACARSTLISSTAAKRGQSVPTRTAAAGPVRTGFRKGMQPNLPTGGARGPAPRPAVSRLPPTPANRPPMRPMPVPYPTWASTPTKRWLFAQYWNATPEQVLKFIVFTVFGGALLLVNVLQAVSEKAKDYDYSQQYVPPPDTVVATPAAAPVAAEAEGVLGPIAVAIDSPRFTGPPDAAMIVSTQQAVDEVAQGNSESNRQQVDAAMSSLERASPPKLKSLVARQGDNQQRFRGFLMGAMPASNEQRRSDMLELAAYLRSDPFDAEAACEWSWLAVLAYDRDSARNGFLRAIWADPQAACGWLGYGTLARDTPTSFGALVMAERLQEGDAMDYLRRDALVEATLVPDDKQVRRWQIMDARARVRAARLRNTAVPPEIEQRAQQLLPQ